MDNIAEGFGKGSRSEFINSLAVARGEVDELKSQLYRGLDIGYFDQGLFDELYTDADLIDKKTTTFINYLNESEIKGQKFKKRK
jgi:four helix bundle protein